MEFQDVPAGDLEALEKQAALGRLVSTRTSGPFTIDALANGYRLPTEVQWEYVARGGVRNPHFRAAYSFGDEETLLETHAWFADNSGRMTQRVATKNMNPLGVSDLHGNVGEWVEDALEDALPGTRSAAKLFAPADPLVLGTSRSLRVIRGAGAQESPPFLRSANYNFLPPGNFSPWVGFRLVRTPWPN